MEIQKSKVYVLLDERSRVLRCEGGYTMSNIDDVSKWTYIDEGTGTDTTCARTTILMHCTPSMAYLGISTRMALAYCGAMRKLRRTWQRCQSRSQAQQKYTLPPCKRWA